MLVKYYLSDNMKASFENFSLGHRNAWADPDSNPVADHVLVVSHITHTSYFLVSLILV